MLEIIKAKYEEDYKIRIEFNDGKSGVVDLKDDLWGSVFEPLKDKHIIPAAKYVTKYVNTI